MNDPLEIQNLAKPALSAEEAASPVHLESRLNELAARFVDEHLFVLYDSYLQLAKAIRTVTHSNLRQMIEQWTLLSKGKVIHIKFQILKDTESLIREFQEQNLLQIERYLQVGSAQLLHSWQEIIRNAPARMLVRYSPEQLQATPLDDFRTRNIKWQMRVNHKLLGVSPTREIAYRDLLTIEFAEVYLKNFASFLHATGLESRDICFRISHCLEENFDHLVAAGQAEKAVTSQEIEELKTKIDDAFDRLLPGLARKNLQHHAFWEEFNGLFRQRIEADLASPALRISLRKISGDPELTEARIRNHPAKWLANQRLFHNQLQVTVEMQVVRMHLARVVDLMLADLETTIFHVGHGGIAGILGVIEKRRNSVEKITREEITSVDQQAAHIPAFPDEAVLEERLQALRHASEQLPEKIALQAQAHFEAFLQGRQSEMPFLRLSLRNVSNLIIKTYFIAPLEDTLLKLPGAYKRTWNQVRDALRLVLFNLGDTNRPGDSAIDRRQLKSVLERAHHQIKEAGENLQKLRIQMAESLHGSLAVCKEHLNPDNLVAQEAMWERNIRGEERLGGLRSGWMRLNQRFRNRWEQFLRIWRRTQADMLRAEFETAAARYRNPYASLRDFADQVKPRPEVMRRLPFYYKQLFAGSEGMGSAQMSNRERELSLAQTAARRMALGTGGAILVLGEALAGKTYFCEHIATTLFKGRLYRISPPPAGSCDVEELAGAFRRSLQSQGSISEMIQGLPRGAVFLMNDLEMWWERSPAGTAAITCIGELIEKYGRDHSFLLNANVHAYSLLRQLTPIETHIISTIVLSPFSRDNLRRTIMIRHHSGGLQFRWKGKEEEELSVREINRLFSRYFDVSSGNIGFALQLWLSHIESVHQQEMTISVPSPLKMPEIQHPDWLVVLTQFVLHKHLSLDRLLRMFDGEPRQDMTQLLEGLLRAGVVIEIAQKVYAIEPYVYPYLITSLKRAQLL